MRIKSIKINVFLKILLSFLTLIVIFLIYSHYEYTQIQVRNITIESKDIPKEFDGKKILFLADFQVDTMTRFNKKQMERVVKVVNLQEKDIILIGGDYSTWNKYTEETYKELEKMQIPQYGVYAVLGNHDYETEEDSVRYHKELGYTLLRNEKVKISIENENIYIAGVEDLWKGSPDAEKALENVKNEDFAILLTHNPEYFEEMTEKGKNLSDIILAGHTHGGQVTLFGKIVASAIENKEKYGYGMKNYGGHKLYITSGVGGTAFEMFIRFFAKPEVVILKLKKI